MKGLTFEWVIHESGYWKMQMESTIIAAQTSYEHCSTIASEF